MLLLDGVQALITIEDITEIINCQQDLSHKIYKEAILTNYSHEQMTPLNCLIGCSE